MQNEKTRREIFVASVMNVMPRQLSDDSLSRLVHYKGGSAKYEPCRTTSEDILRFTGIKHCVCRIF